MSPKLERSTVRIFGAEGETRYALIEEPPSRDSDGKWVVWLVMAAFATDDDWEQYGLIVGMDADRVVAHAKASGALMLASIESHKLIEGSNP